MAKSKSGGTRAMLRGRIANDVYSIGKDGEGKKQQVVRSLAETVANPRTTGQMRGRMIMSTVMQTVSALSQIVDHSFDGIAAGQPSISEFIRRNYALIKNDIANHPEAGNVFAVNAYQQKGMLGGEFVIASGSAVLPPAAKVSAGQIGGLQISNWEEGGTAKTMRDAFGVEGENYLTFVCVDSAADTYFVRFHKNNAVADDTVITAENLLSAFTIENPEGISLRGSLSGSSLAIIIGDGDLVSAGTIISQFAEGKWIHNDAAMVNGSIKLQSASVALPTYPEGSQKFLNGGEL